MRMVGPRLDSGRSSSVALLVRLFSLRIACRSRRVSEASLEVTLIVERPMVAMPEGAANNIVAHLSRPGRWFSRRRCRCVINFVVTEKFGIERTPHFSTNLWLRHVLVICSYDLQLFCAADLCCSARATAHFMPRI